MKYLIFSTIMFLSIAVQDIKAEDELCPECPLGWGQFWTTVQVGTSPVCTYTVVFCYYCTFAPTLSNPFNKPQIFVHPNIYVKPHNSLCTYNYWMIEAATYEKILSRSFIDNVICGQHAPEVQPCGGTDKVVITIDNPLCKVKYKDPEMDVSVVFDCPNKSVYCHSVWEICWNPITQDYDYIIVEGPYTVGEQFECTIYYAPDYEPSDPDDGNYSDCFRAWGTPCIRFHK